MATSVAACRIWVIDDHFDVATFERLGDARALADAGGQSVGALIVGSCAEPDALIAAGADCVKLVERGAAARADSALGSQVLSLNAGAILPAFRPRIVLASGSPDGRAWAARLAVRQGWELISPALRARFDRDDRLVVTALSAGGRYSRDSTFGADETAVLTLAPGIAEAMPADSGRVGTVERVAPLEGGAEAIRVEREIPAEPAEVDIRYADRIVAGGRGVGSADGFEQLARVARALGAGVAASRVAVDLGWIDRARQVGQTGKTVAPALYLACGISGASHHVSGMSQARHIVAINSDPEAPIFKLAHLGLVADLRDVLSELEAALAAEPTPERVAARSGAR
jgi:electron transfer flavoprotein alpha subunit